MCCQNFNRNSFWKVLLLNCWTLWCHLSKTILFPFLPHRSAITCPSFLPPTAFAALPVVQPPSAIKPGLFLKKEQCWPGLTHLSCFWRHVKRAVKIYFKKLNKITSTLLSWMIRLHASISYCSKSVKCYLGQIPLDYLFNQLSKECVWWSQVIQGKISAGVHVFTWLLLSSGCVMRGFSSSFCLWVDQQDTLFLFCLMFQSFQLLSFHHAQDLFAPKDPDFLDSQKCVQWLNTSEPEQKEYICSSVNRPHYAEKWNWVKFLGTVSLRSFFEVNGLRPINTS